MVFHEMPLIRSAEVSEKITAEVSGIGMRSGRLISADLWWLDDESKGLLQVLWCRRSPMSLVESGAGLQLLLELDKRVLATGSRKFLSMDVNVLDAVEELSLIRITGLV